MVTKTEINYINSVTQKEQTIKIFHRQRKKKVTCLHEVMPELKNLV